MYRLCTDEVKERAKEGGYDRARREKQIPRAKNRSGNDRFGRRALRGMGRSRALPGEWETAGSEADFAGQTRHILPWIVCICQVVYLTVLVMDIAGG